MKTSFSLTYGANRLTNRSKSGNSRFDLSPDWVTILSSLFKTRSGSGFFGSQTGQIFITFAVFAILIACLGLFRLVTYAAEQRTKEIGIRKVLGARVTSIVGLLSKDFTILVGIAALIAFPAAWWAMYKWLETFAYRTERTGIAWVSR